MHSINGIKICKNTVHYSLNFDWKDHHKIAAEQNSICKIFSYLVIVQAGNTGFITILGGDSAARLGSSTLCQALYLKKPIK